MRLYQTQLLNNIYYGFHNGAVDVLGSSPTGSGKTRMNAQLLLDFNLVPSAVIAHRQELVSQLSLSMAEAHIRHSLIAPSPLIDLITEKHYKKFGQSFITPEHPIRVGGVRSIRSRIKAGDKWAQQVQIWSQDEGHHVVVDNEWGKARKLFPFARGVGWTATPGRTDGIGLGRGEGGIFDYLAEGPGARDLIDQGYLCDYDLIVPQSSIDENLLKISDNTGEFTKSSADKAVSKSKIVGDTVENYVKYASNKLCLVFAQSIENGIDIAKRFNEAGIRAELLTGDTETGVRSRVLDRFENREIMVIVSVDILGEGTDIPAVECVIFDRPTNSLNLYIQQFGRVLRLLAGKLVGIVIDQVGNYLRHGLPDSPRIWSLSKRPKGSRSTTADPNVIPLKQCTNCIRAYRRTLMQCPHCQHVPINPGRPSIEQVDGMLVRLDKGTLERMRRKVINVGATESQIYSHLVSSGINRGRATILAHSTMITIQEQKTLRDTMALWAGYQRDRGIIGTEREALFYLRFGVDVLTAQALKTEDCRKLTSRISHELQ